MTTAPAGPAPTVASRLAAVRDSIARACAAAGRDPAEVTLVGASKTQPAEVLAAACAAGLCDFGENRAQELLPKAAALAERGLTARWHFIGTLQRNKVRDVLPHIVALHSLDSLRLADELERQLEREATGRRLACYVEVNVGGEASKAGVAPSELAALLAGLRGRSHVEVAGLMTVAPPADDPEQVRPVFRALRELAHTHGLRGLSMGMTEDYPVAIAEGATVVRVGRALFGARNA
jgi:pyridoxal phosphate enzyme (YggS family)